jgi:GTP-binding protein
LAFLSFIRTLRLRLEGTFVRQYKTKKLFCFVLFSLIRTFAGKRRDMEIKQAEFTLSAPVVTMCPKDTKPEYAFIGRSNVGKSSLINMLTNNRKLAKTSSTPGKTLLINHFLINREWYLVDLPGYGYAKRSKKEVDRLDQMIRGYILQREQLVNVFVLVDIRLEPQKIDLEFINWLGISSVPFAIVFTKADKLTANKASQAMEAYKNKLLETWEELPPMFLTSAEKKQGRDEVLNYIEQINKGL